MSYDIIFDHCPRCGRWEKRVTRDTGVDVTLDGGNYCTCSRVQKFVFDARAFLTSIYSIFFWMMLLILGFLLVTNLGSSQQPQTQWGYVLSTDSSIQIVALDLNHTITVRRTKKGAAINDPSMPSDFGPITTCWVTCDLWTELAEGLYFRFPEDGREGLELRYNPEHWERIVGTTK